MTAVQRPATATTSLVFDGATVIDVDQGKLLPGQRVVVVGNRIHAIGASGTVKMPPNAHVIDARGKYLIPGLWDMHTHSQSRVDLYYPLFIAHGVTGIRDAWSVWPIDSLVQWRQEILKGTRVGPPRQLLTGSTQEIYQFREGLSEEEIRSLKARGANFLKLYPFSYSAAAAARRVELPFGGHAHMASRADAVSLANFGMWQGDSVSAMEASDSGMSILDHAGSGDLTPRCVSLQASAERCQPVAERFTKNNTWWVPTLLVEPPGDFSASVEPFKARLKDATEGFWSGVVIPADWLRDAMKDTVSNSRFLSIVQRAGLPILAGSDAAADFNLQTGLPGLWLHAELALYVAAGMTPLEVLRSATLNPARMLHATDSLGTVAVGKLADLVLLDADPLADITNTMAIRAVVANGRYFDRTALDGLLAEARAKRQQEGLPAEPSAP